MSGRAPSTKTPVPIGISPAASPATGSRTIRIWLTSMSSIAQPVTAIEPVTPTTPSAGVSSAPVAAAAVPSGMMLRPIVTGPAPAPAPVNARLTAPAIVPAPGRPAIEITLTLNVALPEPAAGDTVTHGTLGVAVQVTVPLPDCDSRTVCVPVTCVKATPLDDAPK